MRRPTVALIGEAKFLAEPGTASFGAVYGNPFEYGPMMAWKRLLAPGDLFIDIGANVGAYTLWAHQLGAHVVAVEADPSVVVRLRRNLALNNIQDVEIVAAALSDGPRELRFTVGADAVGHIAAKGAAEATQLVPATTLDEVLAGRRAAGIKLDVEGAEAFVLRGAATALSEHRIAALQIEWNEQSGDRSDVAALLAEAGYRFYLPDAEGILRRLDGAPAATREQADVFLLLDEFTSGSRD